VKKKGSHKAREGRKEEVNAYGIGLIYLRALLKLTLVFQK
jgi:hypothetical protein